MSHVLLIKTGTYSPWRVGNVVSPPLGLMSLAAFARDVRPGRDVFRIEDCRIRAYTIGDWLAILRELDPDIIGLSALTVEMPDAVALARLLRELCPRARIVLGGPHASAVGAKALSDDVFDAVVSGEGEVSLVRLLEATDAGMPWTEARAPGLNVRLDDGSIRTLQPGTERPDIEKLPVPAWDLVDVDRYGEFGRMSPFTQGRYAAIFSSRGCPYRCTYCHEVFDKGFRAMSATRVVDEMEHLVDNYGIHEFEFFDDIFNADHDRALAVCDEITRRGLHVRMAFPNGLRGDRLTERLLVALKRAGTIQISFAIETTSPRLQKQIRKHMRIDKLEQSIRIAAELRIMSFGFFMLGFPTETLAEAKATVDFAVGLPLHGAMFFVTMPYEGTEMHEQLQASGVGLERAPSSIGEYAWDPNYGSNTLSEMSPAQLKLLQRSAYMRFYAQPGRVARVLRDTHLDMRDVAWRAMKMVRFSVAGGAAPAAVT